MIKVFHLLKFEISWKNIQRFKTNIFTLITPEKERRVRTGVGSRDGIWFLNAVHFLELSFYRQKSAETSKILSIPNTNLTSWSINNAKIHWHSSCLSQIFKMVKTTIFPMKFDTKQAWCKCGQRKQWQCSSDKFLYLTF